MALEANLKTPNIVKIQNFPRLRPNPRWEGSGTTLSDPPVESDWLAWLYLFQLCPTFKPSLATPLDPTGKFHFIEKYSGVFLAKRLFKLQYLVDELRSFFLYFTPWSFHKEKKNH